MAKLGVSGRQQYYRWHLGGETYAQIAQRSVWARNACVTGAVASVMEGISIPITGIITLPSGCLAQQLPLPFRQGVNC